jgi:ankyrin repeat protein
MLAICCALLGSTPVLYVFVGSGSTAVLRYLLHHGANPNKAYTKGFYCTPLCCNDRFSFWTLLCLFQFLLPVDSSCLILFCYKFNWLLVVMYVMQLVSPLVLFFN